MYPNTGHQSDIHQEKSVVSGEGTLVRVRQSLVFEYPANNRELRGRQKIIPGDQAHARGKPARLHPPTEDSTAARAPRQTHFLKCGARRTVPAPEKYIARRHQSGERPHD